MAKRKATPKPAPKPTAKVNKNNQVWSRNFYIRGFGKVNIGDVATPEALEAWAAYTEVKPKIEDGPDNPTTSSE